MNFFFVFTHKTFANYPNKRSDSISLVSIYEYDILICICITISKYIQIHRTWTDKLNREKLKILHGLINITIVVK